MASESQASQTQTPPPSNLPAVRKTPDELAAAKQTHSPGSSYVEGAEEVTILGDPAKPGMYVQLLKCAPHSQIGPHHHAGDRVAVCLSGSWKFGFGEKFDEAELRELPVGSIYTEPDRQPHFAKVGDRQAIVAITGYGPTDTVFVNPDDDPAKKKKKP